MNGTPRNFPYHQASARLGLCSEFRWAIPVNLTRLVASLEALTSIDPAARTLRLCKRFRECPTITKLPVEIIEMIIKAMLEQERNYQDELWSRAQACGESRCEHVNLPVQESIWDGYYDANQDCKIQAAIWKQMQSSLDRLKPNLKSNFGLGLDCGKQCPPWSERLAYDTHGLKSITQGYLILPSATRLQNLGVQDDGRVENVYYNFHASRVGSFIDPSLLLLTKEQTQRFHTAMKKLDLKPSLASKTIKWPDGELVLRGGDADWSEKKIRAALEKRLEDEEKGPWPRLLNLVHRSCMVVDP